MGIGFISGKEAQTFWSDWQSVALFTCVFALATFAVREYCRIHNCDTLQKFCLCALPKGHNALQIVLLVANFVCIVTMLAGVQDALSVLLNYGKMPVFGIICATMCVIVLCKSPKNVVVANTLALICVILLVITLKVVCPTASQHKHVNAVMPLCYCAFCIATSLGVITQMGECSSSKQNAVVSVVSATVIALLMRLLQTICNYDNTLPALCNLPKAVTYFAVITGLLATLTGIVANAIPLLQATQDIVDDKVVQCVVLFVTALAFGLFGFDFALTFGYLAVSVIGFAITVAVALQLHHRKIVEK